MRSGRIYYERRLFLLTEIMKVWIRAIQEMYDAYDKIFTRCGLTFRPVEADTGAIGGSNSHEFSSYF